MRSAVRITSVDVRTSIPIPGNPWPHEMVITVDDDANSLVELLWIREAWGLQPFGDDLPPLLVDPPDRRMKMNEDEELDIRAWQAAWSELWIAALRHAGSVRDPGLFEALGATADHSSERADLIAAWRVGLTKIVTIPCHGEYTRTIGEHTLLVTDATRDDADMFSAALSQYR